jgi:hypothetical protein
MTEQWRKGVGERKKCYLNLLPMPSNLSLTFQITMASRIHDGGQLATLYSHRFPYSLTPFRDMKTPSLAFGVCEKFLLISLPDSYFNNISNNVKLVTRENSVSEGNHISPLICYIGGK